MRIFHSLSFRLALTYVALFCLSVAALLGLYYWMSVHAPLEASKERVGIEAQAMARTYMLDGEQALVATLDQRAGRVYTRKPFHAFIDSEGRVVTSNLPSWPAYSGETWLRIEADIYRDGDESDHEALVLDRRFDDGARLLVGEDMEDIDEAEEQLSAAASWILPGALILGILGGALMSRAIGKRIETINTAARTVIAGDLSGRVALRGSGDDFDRLGETLNLMLSRIEDLLESIRRVSDSIAHELRTPLARLLVSLEEMDGPDTGRKAALLHEATDEARRLHRMFDALLRIARIESGRHASEHRPVDVRALLEDAVEFHQPDAETKSIALGIAEAAQGTGGAGGTADLTLPGDPDLLFQAVSNLIDNALKYTPAGGSVTVSAERRGPAAVLAVGDTGYGIAAADRDRLTERFYRAEATRDLPGEGLGLSLVAAVAARHRGELRFLDNTPGTRVELILPLDPAPASA